MTVHRASAPRTRRIAIMLHEDSFFIRSVLRGVASYARPAKPWLLERVPPEGFARGRRARMDCDGLITHIHEPALIDALADVTCPVVGVSDIVEQDPFPTVSVDNQAVGRLAAEHLLHHGHRQFAYVGIKDVQFAAQRHIGFAQRLEEDQITSDVHHISARWLLRSPKAEARSMQRFAAWLGSLPAPTGLFAANDSVAWFISEVCRQVGIEIPLQLAVLGVDNDDLLCRMAYPPLSSVIIPGERIGYAAAEQLDHAMRLDKPVRSLALEPTGVETRQSSEFFAVEDEEVSAALKFIRDHATSGITVADVLNEVPLARRALERRFNRLLGRTPLDEIHRVRVDAARQLLSATTLPIEEVARQCGFGRANYMSRLLVRFTGKTPRQFRRIGGE